MELLANLQLGFGVALAGTNILYCFIGVLLGTLIGVLPGPNCRAQSQNPLHLVGINQLA